MKFLIKQTPKLLFLFLFLIVSRINGQKAENKYLNVGDIHFDREIDDPNFKICNPNSSFQYYNFSKGFQYNGEKYDLLEEWKKLGDVISKKSNSGYITVRFLVNCEGKTGLFRVQQMNFDFTETFFEEDFANKILNFVKSLKGWVIVDHQNENVDYYQYLTFKIENGIVKEILP